MRIQPLLAATAYLSVLAATVSSASASLSGNTINPTRYAQWEWEQRPLDGNVILVESGREVPDPKTGKPEQRIFGTSRFTRDAKGNRVERVGPERKPYQTNFFDAAGRLVRAEGQSFDVGTRQRFGWVEALQFDAAGNLAQVETQRDGQLVNKVTGATEPLPGGGRRTRLEETGEDGTAVVHSYDF